MEKKTGLMRLGIAMAIVFIAFIPEECWALKIASIVTADIIAMPVMREEVKKWNM